MNLDSPADHPLARAFELAEGVVGTTSPNPAVGAVLVRDGEIVGEGATQPPGGPHAEVVALRQAGERARGAVAYVSLEPCSHHGRTPPCTDALIAAGVARAVCGMIDPDRRVAGQGLAALDAAGIPAAIELAFADRAARFYAAYSKHRRTGLPYVIAKFAASLDGKIATASGDSRWISREEARAWAHRLRVRVDAIAVGSGTVMIDDPLLTARPEGATGEVHQPLRVVFDSTGKVEPAARVLGGPVRTLVLTTEASPATWRAHVATTGAEIAIVPAGADGRVDVARALGLLGERGIVTLLVEGGGTLLGSFFDAREVDAVRAVIAPIVVGSREAPSAVAGRGAATVAEALRLEDVEVERLGPDILVSGSPAWPAADIG